MSTAPLPRVRSLQWILLGGAFLALGVLLRAITRPMGFGDAETYLLMAQRVGEFTSSPHGYRILIPYLAAFLSNLTALPLPDAFVVLTLTAFVGVNLTLTIWFNRTLKLPLRTALLLTALYIFSYAGIYNLHNAVHVGYWEHWFLLLGFIAIYHSRFWFLAAVVFVSVWVKETVVLLFPLYFVTAWRDSSFRPALVRTIILIAIFLSVFILLRSGLFLSGTTGLSTYSNFYTLGYVQFVLEGWKQINPLKEIYFAFQFLWLLALYGFLHSPQRARWTALLVPLALSQILLATDTQRMTALAFPAILLLVSFLFRNLSFAEQCFVAVLNPLAFLLYNFHARYVLLLTLTTLGWLTLWLVSQLVLHHSALITNLKTVIPFRSERTLWLATALTLIGILTLVSLDTVSHILGNLGLGLALIGTAVGTLTLVARSAGGFPLSPRM